MLEAVKQLEAANIFHATRQVLRQEYVYMLFAKKIPTVEMKKSKFDQSMWQVETEIKLLKVENYPCHTKATCSKSEANNKRNVLVKKPYRDSMAVPKLVFFLQDPEI